MIPKKYEPNQLDGRAVAQKCNFGKATKCHILIGTDGRGLSHICLLLKMCLSILD